MTTPAVVASVDVDVADLLQVEVSYGKLQVLLTSLLARVTALEKAKNSDVDEETSASDGKETTSKPTAKPDTIDGDPAGLEAKDLRGESPTRDDSTPADTSELEELKKRLQAVESAQKESGTGDTSALLSRIAQLESDVAELKARGTESPATAQVPGAQAAPAEHQRESGDLEARVVALETATRGLPVLSHPALLKTSVEVAPVAFSTLRLAVPQDNATNVVDVIEVDDVNPTLRRFSLEQQNDNVFTLACDDGRYLTLADGAPCFSTDPANWSLTQVRCGVYRLSLDGKVLALNADRRAVTVAENSDANKDFKLIAVNTLEERLSKCAGQTEVDELRQAIQTANDATVKSSPHDSVSSAPASEEQKGTDPKDDAVESKVSDLDRRVSEIEGASDHDAVKAKLAALEAQLAEHAAALKEAGDLQGKCSELDDAMTQLRQSHDSLEGQMRVFASQMEALAGMSPKEGDAPQGSSEVTAAQFQMLRGTVEGLRKSVDGLLGVPSDLDSVRSQLEQLGASTAALDAAINPTINEIESHLGACDRRLDDLSSRVLELGPEVLRLHETLKHQQEATKNLQDAKANRSELPRGTAGVTKDVFDASMEELRKKISEKSQPQPITAPTSAVSDEVLQRLSRLEAGARTGSSDDREDLSALAADVKQAAQDALRDAQRNKEQIIEIRATIDHIHHTKADASLVANKAERDYVENALEKLMREVEQVMNSTNAGLIDTLDKSLGILRDMIDGKASKADLARMRNVGGGAEEPGTVPEGLMGYKSYRCLGCNRTVDAMRTRPMGSNFSNFMNRLPASPRQPAPPRSAPGESRAGGYLTAGPT